MAQIGDHLHGMFMSVRGQTKKHGKYFAKQATQYGVSLCQVATKARHLFCLVSPVTEPIRKL